MFMALYILKINGLYTLFTELETKKLHLGHKALVFIP
jgi:hypothetical protein